MTVSNLAALAETVLTEARNSKNGRASQSLIHGDRLTVTLIGLSAGQALGEHNAPPAATLQLLQGRATLHTRSDSAELSSGELVPIPRVRHDLVAAEDTVALLTVALDA